MGFECPFCGKSFKRESTAETHACERKKRWLAREEDWFVAALRYFDWWHCLTNSGKGAKSAEDFVRSPFYGAFAEFGKFTLRASVGDPDAYFKWLVSNSHPIDRWTSKEAHRRHLAARSRSEPASDAVLRFVRHLESWRERNGEDAWIDYCEKAPDNMIFRDIKSGVVSPWVFLCMPAMKKRVGSMPEDLSADMLSGVDMKFWAGRLRRESADADWVRRTLEP